MRDAGLYNIQVTPSYYILTKEGYVIKQMVFENKPESVEDFFAGYNPLVEEIAEYENTISAARSGKTEDRLAAINRLFEKTDPQLRYLLADFCSDYIKLDKKNSTGMVGSYVVALANSNAVQHYLDQDPLAASEEFATAAKSKFLEPEQKQQCFYTAAYLFASSGTDDAVKVKDYLQKAYDVAPDSEYAESILSMMRMMEEKYGESAEPPADAPEAKDSAEN